MNATEETKKSEHIVIDNPPIFDGAATATGGNPPTLSDASGDTGGERPREHRHSWVAILVTILGVLVLIGVLVFGAVTEFWRGTTKSFTADYEAAAAEQLVIDLDYGDLEIEFSEGATDATLNVSGHWRDGTSPVEMSNAEDGTLVIETVGEWNWNSRGQEIIGTLTLPADLQNSIALNADVGVGRLVVNGELGAVEADVDVGELVLNERFDTGTFHSSVGSVSLMSGGGQAHMSTNTGRINARGEFDILTMEVDIGQLEADVTVHERAEFIVETGDGQVMLNDPMPAETIIDTNIGSVDASFADVPMQFEASRDVAADAEDAGYTTNAGADAPKVSIHSNIGDVEFRPPNR
ncbi:MAG: hypothetical protein ACTHXA_02130 [Gulosibacter sp.]|uniref:hypothetical protein n=1 Tax=Gulosibacter sp. TaxID=2817531 RepID=UPI003F8EA21B